MRKNLLAIVPLACAMTSVFAGTDPFLEYNCMGLSGPSIEATVVSTVAAKPAMTAVLKKNKSLGASSMARRTLTGAAGPVAMADRDGVMVKVSCDSANGKC